ncbi:helix-turn-helix transcriptional regulator [Streptomyces sp. NPDC059740]|uniref:helix-turn-helix transcriptional regulator n=1 Tax=Streptomyces sp. NPDC059740 TaxID=3346926 RepID=UPI00365329F1
MRADRLLTLLLLLQNRGRMTAPQLAAELEVSVRTVYRDVEALGAAGVPVHAERGPEGGYRLVDGYRTRLTGLTAEEAAALFLAGGPGPARDLGLGPELAAARLKLTAALPPGTGDRAQRVQERFHLDPAAWFRDADAVPHLATVATAVWEQQVLDVHYRRWAGEVHRRLLPLGLVLKGGIWYLAATGAQQAAAEGAAAEGAAPGAEEAVRTYRVSRLLAAEPAGDRFERPAGFDLAAYWERSAHRLEAARHRGTALVRLSPRGVALLPMWFGAAGRRALADAGEPDAEGWVRVELAVEGLAVAVGDLLRLGTEAEVVGPPELRAAVAGTVAVLAGRYRAAPPPGPPRAAPD